MAQNKNTTAKYVLSAADAMGIDTTVYDTYDQAYNAMCSAYALVCTEENDNNIIGEWSAQCVSTDMVNGEAITYWEITEVKF